MKKIKENSAEAALCPDQTTEAFKQEIARLNDKIKNASMNLKLERLKRERQVLKLVRKITTLEAEIEELEKMKGKTAAEIMSDAAARSAKTKKPD